jgi:hypothetical protein
MHDLRGHSARWEESELLKAFRQSPVGKSLLSGPEMDQLTRWQNDMKKHFDLDWPALRDDILGDTLLFSYSPGPKNKEEERGLFLLHVRKPERLVQFVDKLNEIQKKTGELRSLTALEYKGITYYRRAEPTKTQYYFVKDSLAAVTSREDLLHGVIDKLPKATRDNRWTKPFQRAQADAAFLTMCVNPRKLEPDIVRGKKEDALPSYWNALDAIFVTLAVQDAAELRISIQANPKELPAWAKPAFTETISPSSLWQRFPEKSILTIAAKTDFAGTAEALALLMPEKERKKLASDWQGGVGALFPIDPIKDVLPNLGPDWGICILPAKNAQELPQAMFALAVEPGPKKIDTALVRGAEVLAGLAILDYNRNNPNARIQLKSKTQDKIEIKYLDGDSAFPPGLRPACALKDGYLLLATSPEAIGDFRAPPANAPAMKEAPMIRLSTREVARLLDQRRAHIVASLTDRQQMSDKEARKNLDDVIAVLNLFDQLTLSQHGADGQASWSLRLTPAPR